MSLELLNSIEYFTDDGERKYYKLDNLTRDELLTTFVEIEEINTDDFLKIKETLTRIGIASRDKKVLYQSVMLFHKKGRFYLTHFKELFGMDGRYVEMYEDDYVRRNHIATLLESWGLIKIKNKSTMYAVVEDRPINVYILPHKEKRNWKLESKYTIGGFLKNNDKKGNV